jgi:tetratricopeptide (TPR) repeat protein
MNIPRCRLLPLSAALLVALSLGGAQALPTVDEVQAAAQRGDYASAERMTREVVADRPDSAHAHYVLAEILVRERKFADATHHAQQARALDPELSFTDSAAFTAFERVLQREHAADPQHAPATPAAPLPPPARNSGMAMPVWLLIVVAIVVVWLVLRWLRRHAGAPPAATDHGESGGVAPAARAAGTQLPNDAAGPVAGHRDRGGNAS